MYIYMYIYICICIYMYNIYIYIYVCICERFLFLCQVQKNIKIYKSRARHMSTVASTVKMSLRKTFNHRYE